MMFIENNTTLISGYGSNKISGGFLLQFRFLAFKRNKNGPPG
jgi:hypothetical protein